MEQCLHTDPKFKNMSIGLLPTCFFFLWNQCDWWIWKNLALVETEDGQESSSEEDAGSHNGDDSDVDEIKISNSNAVTEENFVIRKSKTNGQKPLIEEIKTKRKNKKQAKKKKKRKWEYTYIVESFWLVDHPQDGYCRHREPTPKWTKMLTKWPKTVKSSLRLGPLA